MGDYNLAGLSTRSFERLIQAIALKVLGPGLVVFGDGPDGGREAAFEGKVPFPSSAAPWDGYCVLQAKFLQRPGDSGKDGKWALQQLEKELKDFIDPEKRRQVPEYYIFATNVVLTPVGDKGGKDQVAKLINRYKKRMNLRDWRVWDFDQISTFLDALEDVRRAYAAWVTPGDVLAKVIEQLKPPGSDFLDVMTNFLAKELLADQFANLGQAGHATEDKIALANVFVDLPATNERSAEPPAEEKQDGVHVVEFVSEVIARARDRFDQETLMRHSTPPDAGKDSTWTNPYLGRYVLIGGPGQGKTTLGQFACQLFRAAIIQGRPSHVLAPEVRQTLGSLVLQCEKQKLPLPATRRFPIRVVLSTLAAALEASKKKLSLITYVSGLIGDVTGYQVSSDVLRQWLAAYPWLIVLDGLDEVPASANREELLIAIQNFWIDVAQCNADVMVIATTRPQGYNADFSPRFYRHLWLAPLSSERALKYAERLVESRWGADPFRSQKALSRLEQASRTDTTARLMRSPLQVTIMTLLVEQTGPPPQDRWRLFHDYYDVIYRRERERDIPAAKLLREHRADVDAIHSHVALALQVESEIAGSTEARMSTERFASIVKSRLEEEGQAGEALAALSKQIIDAAANRLVFLVGVQEGQVGFEIRSLQEFMASEALMSGNDSLVQDRLRHIAPLTSWRNVFLFAAGRCFAKDQYRRDTIFAICAELNADDNALVRFTLAGSLLALDLLEEGLSRGQPKYARLLADNALKLIDVPPSEAHARLVDSCEPQIEELYRSILESRARLGIRNEPGCWAALIALAERGVEWARVLVSDCWPALEDDLGELLALDFSYTIRQWLAKEILRLGSPVPIRVYAMVSRLAPDVLESVGDPWARLFDWEWGREMRREARFVELPGILTLTWFSVESSKANIAKGDLGNIGVGRDWIATWAGLDFGEKPSSRSLVQALRRIRDSNPEFPLLVPPNLPWVARSCFTACKSLDDLERLIRFAEGGELGDFDEWTLAETRWSSQGVGVRDLVAYSFPPLDRDIALKGFPFASGGLSMTRGERTEQEVELVVAIYRQLELAPEAQKRFSWLALNVLSDYKGRVPPNALEPSLVERWLLEERYVEVPGVLVSWAKANKLWAGCLDILGKVRRVDYRTVTPAGTKEIARLFSRDPSLGGLLRLLSYGLQAGHRFDLSIKVDALRYVEAEIQSAAIIVELAQGRTTPDRARMLAEAAGDLVANHNQEVFSPLTAALDYFDSTSAGVEEFLLTAWQSLPRAAWSERSSILQLLNGFLRQRKSLLADASYWESLRLPPRPL